MLCYEIAILVLPELAVNSNNWGKCKAIGWKMECFLLLFCVEDGVKVCVRESTTCSIRAIFSHDALLLFVIGSSLYHA